MSENQLLLKKIVEGDCQQVDVRFTDVMGNWRHVTLPAGQVTDSFFTNGVGIDGSTLRAMTKTEAGDLAIVPDTRRALEDPFADRRTIFFFSNIVDPRSGLRFSRDPRTVAERASEFARESGIATETLWAPEFEFYLFDKARFWLSPGRIGYEIESCEGPEYSGSEESRGLVHTGNSAYCSISPLDRSNDVRAEIASVMQRAGIDVKYHHHEVGRMGQAEIEVSFAPLLAAADNIMLTKYIVRNVASRNRLAATFMPKPLPDEPGSGLHIHFFFSRNDERIFHAKEGYFGMSTVALNAVAGLLHHAPALCAFTNASVNSYQRLVPGQEAPVYRFFSGANRTAAVRIPAYATSPESMRMEYRVPDASGNPYLCLAAMLMAAADGIIRKLDPKAFRYGPIDDNVFRNGFDRSQLARLPTSLEEALRELQNDRVFLERSEVFSADLIEEYIKEKELECSAFRGNPHPLEHKLYFNV